jgi:hypothetical protein
VPIADTKLPPDQLAQALLRQFDSIEAPSSCSAGAHGSKTKWSQERLELAGCNYTFGMAPLSPCPACFACPLDKYQNLPHQWSCKDCPQVCVALLARGRPLLTGAYRENGSPRRRSERSQTDLAVSPTTNRRQGTRPRRQRGLRRPRRRCSRTLLMTKRVHTSPLFY